MAKDQNTNVIIDYFDGTDKADDAADSLEAWDRDNDDVVIKNLFLDVEV